MKKQSVAKQAAVGSVVKRKPDAIDALYNPAPDGPAAKLWELLRRNPAFREDAAWILKHVDDPTHQATIARYICSLISAKDDITRRFAGYVLRWLWHPVYLQPHEILELHFGHEVAKILSEDFVLNFFGPVTDAAWDRYRHLTPAEFMKVCPIYLLPGERANFWDNQKDWIKLFLPTELKKEYLSPLSIERGEFSLDTPWPKAPEIFRNHFIWLWANYDANTPNPYTGDRSLLPSTISIGFPANTRCKTRTKSGFRSSIRS